MRFAVPLALLSAVQAGSPRPRLAEPHPLPPAGGLETRLSSARLDEPSHAARVAKAFRPVVDTFAVERFNIDVWVDGTWANDSRYLYTLNGQGRTTGYTLQAWLSEAWSDVDTALFAYDGQGRLVGQEWRYRDSGGQWTPLGRSLIAYHGDSAEVYLAQIWLRDSAQGEWGNYYRATRRFEAGKEISETVEVWAVSAARWSNYNRKLTAYGTHGFPVQVLYQSWISAVPAWAHEGKDSLLYDPQNRLAEIVTSGWDLLAGDWEPIFRLAGTRDSAGRTREILYQFWDENAPAWANDGRELYAYDFRGHDSDLVLQIWETGVWVDYARTASRADSNGNVLERVRLDWNAGLSEWTNSARGRWVFRGMTPVALARPRPQASPRPGFRLERRGGAVGIFEVKGGAAASFDAAGRRMVPAASPSAGR